MLESLPLPFVLAFAFIQNATLPTAPAPSHAAVQRATVAETEADGTLHPPVVIYQVNPEFTEAARKRHFSGDVEVSLVVDEHGRPRNVVLVHGVGMGLDEAALAAVKQYRFKPATKDGRPIAMQINTAVNFQIF